MTAHEDFARALRAGGRAFGYWVVLDNPAGTERIARAGYDYVALDAQHGLFDYAGLRNGLLAIDASQRAVGVVRAAANDPVHIGRALDAGAVAVIVPLIDTAEDAAAAVAAARYPSAGTRSYGPMRSALRVGPAPAEADAATMVFAMIETADGLANLEQIAATPGLDGLYVGPSDLTLALGGRTPADASVAPAFDAALERVLAACAAHGIVPGIHTPDGRTARVRAEQGFRLITIASDLVHLEAVARQHLGEATQSGRA